jgi:uncharacterized membrane protein YkvA (DUF1232 family)
MKKKALDKQLAKAEKKASSKMKDKAFIGKLLYQVINKLRSNPPKFNDLKDQINLIIDFLKQYLSGNYKNVNKSSVITLVAALIYFVNPFDLIMDYIPGIGYLDDMGIIMFVYQKLSQEFQDFKDWKADNEKRPSQN